MAKRIVRPWPTGTQLMAWGLFEKLDGVSPGDLTPEMLESWIKKYEGYKPSDYSKLHRHLYSEFAEFAHRFSPPD